MGWVWLNLEKNVYYGIEDYEKVLDNILNGKKNEMTTFSSTIKKYEKKYRERK